jgi:hypothetical protein
MKITSEVVQAMRQRIAAFDTEDNRNAYREGRFPRADAVKDLNMRYRWDLYHAARGREALIVDGRFPEDVTSDHIDTALRRIVRPLI